MNEIAEVSKRQQVDSNPGPLDRQSDGLPRNHRIPRCPGSQKENESESVQSSLQTCVDRPLKSVPRSMSEHMCVTAVVFIEADDETEFTRKHAECTARASGAVVLCQSRVRRHHRITVVC